MRNKKVEKIKNIIVLSIKYARLKEEINGTEAKKLVLSEKKKLIGSNEKKIDKSNQFIEGVKIIINQIEQNNKLGSYSVIINNQLNEKLRLLSKQKDFNLIKYGIAIDVIMDDEFKYTDNTNTDFLENISLMLFNDKTVIKKIDEDYKRIANRIYGTSSASGDIKLNKQTKKLSILSPGDLARQLIINAMNLLYASNHFYSEMEYREYFEDILTEVNRKRKIIMKEMFQDQYETDANRLKIEILHNFDDYIIEQMSLKSKKKGK